MDEQEFRQRLMVNRIIWAAMIMGLLMFLGVVLVIGPNNPPGDPQFMRILLYIAIIMAVGLPQMGFLIRRMIWNKAREPDGAVSAGAYANGNILLWAMCEGSAFIALVGALLNGGRGPHLWVAVIPLAVMALTIPTGAPMRGSNL